MEISCKRGGTEKEKRRETGLGHFPNFALFTNKEQGRETTRNLCQRKNRMKPKGSGRGRGLSTSQELLRTEGGDRKGGALWHFTKPV